MVSRDVGGLKPRPFDVARTRIRFSPVSLNHGEHDGKWLLLNMITTRLHIGLAPLWSGMMAWAGMRLGGLGKGMASIQRGIKK